MSDQLFHRRQNQRRERISKEKVSRNETWLFVCEGQNTEKFYFNDLYNYLKQQYGQQFHFKFKVEGMGRNTQDLIDNIEPFFEFVLKKERANKIPFGKTFAVFDKDSFKPNQFDNAIFTAKNNGYIPIWSNECFELWFLLHFDLLESNNDRNWYYNKLSQYLGKEYGKSEENDRDTFSLLFAKGGTIQNALRNSKRLYENSCTITSPSKRAPCTTVFKVFDEIKNETNIDLY